MYQVLKKKDKRGDEPMIYMPEGIRNSETHGNEVDFIVTHCCATSTQALV